MPIERLFSETDVQRLIDCNATPDFGPRNAAMVMGAVYWGLTPSELTLLPLEAVMAQGGEFYETWVLPEHVAYNGEPRELHTADHALPFFEQYMDWRLSNDVYRSNLHWYRGSDPKAAFFVNDRYEGYRLSPRAKGSSSYQARTVRVKLQSLIDNAGIQGAKPAAFRDSFVKAMYDEGCREKDLMAVSGIKQKETIDRKVRPQPKELDKVFKDLFSRVKMAE